MVLFQLERSNQLAGSKQPLRKSVLMEEACSWLLLMRMFYRETQKLRSGLCVKYWAHVSNLTHREREVDNTLQERGSPNPGCFILILPNANVSWKSLLKINK